MIRATILSLIALLPAAAAADEQVDFATQIQPIFREHCIRCHGERVAKAELRLHTAAAILQTGIDHLFSPENPDDGEVLFRVTLPADDELHMPQGGDSLPDDAIELIRRWVSQGATIPEGADDATTQPPSLEDRLPDVPPAPPEAIEKLEAAGAQVLGLFDGSPLLRVTFAYADETAGNDEVALLTDVAPQVVWLNLARSEVTDAGTAPLATLDNLMHLHLELTGVGDEAVAHLAGLEKLEYLNLYGTKVTDEGLKQLAALKNLKRLYLWQTPVSYDAAMALQEATDGLEVNLGWNHPEVARRRLTAELDRVVAQKEDATQRLVEAQREQEAATKREEEIKKELEALGVTEEQKEEPTKLLEEDKR